MRVVCSLVISICWVPLSLPAVVQTTLVRSLSSSWNSSSSRAAGTSSLEKRYLQSILDLIERDLLTNLESSLAVLVGFPALHIHAVVVVRSVQACISTTTAGPVHLVDHLLGQADRLLPTLPSALRDLASLNQLKYPNWMIQPTKTLFMRLPLRHRTL